MTTIDISGISKTYDKDSAGGGIEALRDVSIQIESGEFVAVVGPTGCDKSTLLEIIAGLTTPTTGDVTIEEIFGVDIPRPRDAAVFGTDRFNFLTQRVWDVLRPEAKSGLE